MVEEGSPVKRMVCALSKVNAMMDILSHVGRIGGAQGKLENMSKG